VTQKVPTQELRVAAPVRTANTADIVPKKVEHVGCANKIV